jgi:hypothetical protein
MKKQIAVMLLASTLLSSCEKYETATPTPQQSTPRWDLRPFTLDVSMFDVQLTNHGSYQTGALVDSGTQYGYVARFSNTTPDYSVDFVFSLDMGGNVLQLIGTYNGHPFVLHEGAINVCEGAQGAPINFSIR